MDLQLRDKRAIVTGASGGIGIAIAHALAAEGVDLVLAARSREPLEKAAAAVAERSGRRVHALVTDVRDGPSVLRLVEEILSRLGGVEILVNSASNQVVGKHMPPLAGTSDDIFWDDVDTKVGGYLRTSRAVAPHLIANGWGRIINLGGLGARETRSIVRSVRNAGVAALTKNLADELGPHGVNVTVVHPGLTRTPQLSEAIALRAAEEERTVADLEDELGANGLGRLVDATEVADVVAFLASPRSVSINGDAVSVGGGTRGVIHY